MENITCSLCGRGMSLKDLEKQTFREVKGKLYCPECLLKKGQPKKMRCPDCAKQTIAVIHDGKYMCTHCGRQIGGEQQSGVIDSALPAANRGDDATRQDTPPLPPRAPRRRKNRGADVLVVLLGCFVVSTLVLVALLVRNSRPAPPQQTAEQPESGPTEADKKLSTDEAVLLAIDQWNREHPKDHHEAVENYNVALRILTDPTVRQKATLARDKLRQEMQLTTERENQNRRIQELEAKLVTALSEIEKLKNTPVPKTDTGATPDTPPKETPPTTVPVPPTAPATEKAPERDAETAYHRALSESRRLVGDRKHGLAMKTMEALAQTLSGTEWAKKAGDERLRIQRDAEQIFNKQAERADELVRGGDYTGARKLYDELHGLGVPVVEQLVQRKLDEIRQLDGKTPEPKSSLPSVSPGVPAAVRQLIQVLRSGTGPERGEAARKLGTFGEAAAVPHLIAALKDSEWLVRACAAKSLGQLSDTSAVPALLDALDDERESVSYDATEALKALTKQTFSRAEKAKWLAWYEANKATLRPEPAAKPPEPIASFPSTILGLRYDTSIVSFVVPDGVPVKAGTKIRLMIGAEQICDVEINQVATGEAYGRITGMRPGTKLEPGDKVTIQMPQ